ncbi:MAG: hypothetical protein M3548_14320 [Actinomycetota bacterium]|nr:hypothetical protein [Actinomycetota bacterium]
MSLPCEELPQSDLGEIDALLRAVVADGFTMYLCGGADQPEAIVATYAWEDHVDFVVIKGEGDVTAARSRSSRDWNVFTAESVVWSYQGHARWALRALLDLVAPDHPQAPDEEYAAPESIRVAPADLRRLSIRSPMPGSVERRAMRLRLAAWT